MKVRIQKEALTDGSHVFNVALVGFEQVFVMHAISEKAAEELADTIVTAVNRLTVDSARLAFA